MWSLLAEAVTRFALDQPIDEVGRLDRPSIRDLVRMNLDLLGQNVISDLLPILAMIRSLPMHAFIGNDTHGKVINSDTMVLPTHDLGCHIPRRSRRVLRVLRVPESGDTQICDPHVAIHIEYQVLRLDVSVKNCVFVEIFKT